MAIKYQIETVDDDQIHQGDVFQNLHYYEKYIENTGRFELSLLKFPYSVVLSQECDLDTNRKERITIGQYQNEIVMHDKFMVSLLCAPLYNAEHLFAGKHLSELDIDTEIKNSKQKEYIKSNRNPRYHYIEFEDSALLVPMIIDFKHFFTVSISELKECLNKRKCSIKPLFRESITQRFANFLSRIGLPEVSQTNFTNTGKNVGSP